MDMHEHLTQAQLAERLEKAKTQVTIGERYMHYKQHSYIVRDIALREEDNEPCVIYQAEYGERITFIRPVTNWLEYVEVDDRKVPRFSKAQ